MKGINTGFSLCPIIPFMLLFWSANVVKSTILVPIRLPTDHELMMTKSSSECRRNDQNQLTIGGPMGQFSFRSSDCGLLCASTSLNISDSGGGGGGGGSGSRFNLKTEWKFINESSDEIYNTPATNSITVTVAEDFKSFQIHGTLFHCPQFFSVAVFFPYLYIEISGNVSLSAPFVLKDVVMENTTNLFNTSSSRPLNPLIFQELVEKLKLVEPSPRGSSSGSHNGHVIVLNDICFCKIDSKIMGLGVWRREKLYWWKLLLAFVYFVPILCCYIRWLNVYDMTNFEG